ncbi:MAG: Uma2 family endonuclease [Gemmatimonadaceae bacterium]|nr:Uma2 family endonuclease [Gemmatimonadaceae bacterium]
MRAATDLMTAEQLVTYSERGLRTELVRGRMVVREPAGYRHGSIAARVLTRISVFLETDQTTRSAVHPLGEVLAAETGFTLQRSPDTVRAPDVAFVSWDRRPTSTGGFAELAPDLAVEVLSPRDRPGEVLAKVADWLTAGSTLVWVVDPDRRQVRVYRADGSALILCDRMVIDGEGTLPGFVLPLDILFG